jgi:Protein of unknown function (DUF3168)
MASGGLLAAVLEPAVVTLLKTTPEVADLVPGPGGAQVYTNPRQDAVPPYLEVTAGTETAWSPSLNRSDGRDVELLIRGTSAYRGTVELVGLMSAVVAALVDVTFTLPPWVNVMPVLFVNSPAPPLGAVLVNGVELRQRVVVFRVRAR